MYIDIDILYIDIDILYRERYICVYVYIYTRSGFKTYIQVYNLFKKTLITTRRMLKN